MTALLSRVEQKEQRVTQTTGIPAIAGMFSSLDTSNVSRTIFEETDMPVETNVSAPLPAPLPYLLDPDFEFLLSGRWEKGGLLEIYRRQSLVDFLWLPLAKWAVLAVLALRAQSAQGKNWKRAFVTVDELGDELGLRTRLQVSDRTRVIRNVFETRQVLNNAAARKLQAAWDPGPYEWGKRVIEYSGLGYRLSLPPENVRIEILRQNPVS